MDPFATLSDWPGRAAAAVVQPDGSIERWGDTTEPFALASVTKLLTAMTVLIAHEEGYTAYGYHNGKYQSFWVPSRDTYHCNDGVDYTR